MAMRRSPLLPIFLIVLVDVFGLTLVLPLLAIYAETLHASPLQATLLQSVYAGCGLISAPILGKVSDRIGRKPMLLVSQVGTCIGFLIMARAGSLWVLYLARVIDGSTAGNLSLAQAYISDNTPAERRSRAFGLIGIAFGLGFFVGPAITGYLANYTLSAPIYVAAALSFTSILCTLTLLPWGAPPKEPAVAGAPGPGGQRLGIFNWGSYAEFFKRPVLAGLLIQFFFYQYAFSTFTSGFALFAERRFSHPGHPFGVRQVGFLFAYVGLLGIILQGGLIGRMTRKWGEPALVAAGFVTMIVGYFFLGLAGGVVALVVLATFTSFGNAVIRPVLTSLVTQRGGRHEQGVILGLTGSLASIAMVVAPIISGLLIQKGQLMAWAWVASLGAGLGLCVARWGSSRALPPESAVPKAVA